MRGTGPSGPWSGLKDVDAFAGLQPETRDALAAVFSLETISRGEFLLRRGEDADTLYIVVSGRFAVFLDCTSPPVAEIGPGQPVGEIAFFAGGQRTASVKALRDSVVLRLSRTDFDALAAKTPSIYPAVVRTLARRLAETTAGRDPEAFLPPKTIAISRAGHGDLSPGLVDGLRTYFSNADRTALFLDHETVSSLLKGDETFASLAETGWFNQMEERYDHVIYLCDADLNTWSEKAIRQADHVVFIADFDTPQNKRQPNAIEKLAAELHDPEDNRLALLHPKKRLLSGTPNWLAHRPWVGMHHHLVVGDDTDIARLMRFVLGNAQGLVACGGGAYTAAHIGMYAAVCDAGIEIDIMGGTSGGSAMTAAFALGVPVDEIDRRIHDMFVVRKAMGRWTWPRYSLLDHSVFDAALREHYTECDVADLWLPFFAIATNLSKNAPHIIRSGPLWAAVRTSSAIPALLPPTVTADGELLVDGCLIDNTPLHPMRSLKAGPNIVFDLDAADTTRFPSLSGDLPSRGELVRQMLYPGQYATLPQAPSPQAVLMRALMRERPDIAGELAPGDTLLSFKVPQSFGILDWSKHSELRQAAYDFATGQFAASPAR